MTDIVPGQVWECHEGRADEALHDFGADYRGLGSRFVRFRAIVEHVDGDLIVLSVGTRNRHLKAPDPGAEVVKSAANLRSEPKWTLHREAVSQRDSATDGGAP